MGTITVGRWPDPWMTAWGLMALRTAEQAGIEGLANHPTGLSEMEICGKAYDSQQTNPYIFEDEWIGDNLAYPSLPISNVDGVFAGCLAGRLLCGANPSHPIFVGGEAQAGSLTMFPQGDEETSEQYEARLEGQSNQRYNGVPIGTQTTLGGWLADNPPMLDPWATYFTGRIAAYVGDDAYRQQLKALLEENQINSPGSHTHGSWTLGGNSGNRPTGPCGRHFVTCLFTAALAEAESGPRIQPP